MGCAQFVRVIDTTSTRKMRRVDSRLLNDGGHGMLYAVLADAIIYTHNTADRRPSEYHSLGRFRLVKRPYLQHGQTQLQHVHGQQVADAEEEEAGCSK